MNDVQPICALCGQIADADREGDPPLGWCCDVVEERGGTRTRWICPRCTRENVRAIEAKLDQQWW